MFDNEIMMQGEKLKKIRKIMLGATQKEIAEGVCTKAMISLIESNKKNLKYILATGIAGNLNRIAKKKGMDISLITPEELMIDEDEQVNYIFTNIMNELQEIKEIDLFDQKLWEAEELIEKYNIADNKKIELYKLAADFYYNKNRYSKSDQMCDLGLKISINSQNSFEEMRLYIYKSRTSVLTGNYIKALQQLDYAEKLNNGIMDDELSAMRLHYKALTYKKLGEYDTALKYFKILKKLEIKDYKMLLRSKMVYANCLNDCHKFDEAEKEYRETLNIAMNYDDKNFLSMIYRNLSELYFNKEKYKDAAEYIKISLKNHPENEFIGETLYFASKVLQRVNEEVDMYLLRALEICEREDRENLNLVEQIIYELVLLYIKKEDEENLMLMADKAKDLNIDYSLIYAEIGEYYRGRNEKKSKYFSKKSREKMKQNKKKLNNF